jgi:hypothetical protein
MQQQFSTRNISVRDFEEWDSRHELLLSPKFQRRDVWNPKAKSYLIDTILRGKPIPKLYMRQDINPSNRRTVREIVDGQQRVRTVLSFIKDGFKILRTHHDVYGGRTFTGLDDTAQRDILKYEFVVDLLQDMQDRDIYDIFARINTYGEKLTYQELRNAKFFGEFKTSAYFLAGEFVNFFEMTNVFTAKRILRMAEVEFVSELLIAIHEGIRESKKTVIDKAYVDYDDNFPGRKLHEKRFGETMDAIGDITRPDLPNLRFRGTRLLYPLFCAIYHMKYGLPRLTPQRAPIRSSDYPKLKAALEEVDTLIGAIEDADDQPAALSLSAEEEKFYDAYNEHWVHADKRTTMTQYLCRRFLKVLK